MWAGMLEHRFAGSGQAGRLSRQENGDHSRRAPGTTRRIGRACGVSAMDRDIPAQLGATRSIGDELPVRKNHAGSRVPRLSSLLSCVSMVLT